MALRTMAVLCLGAFVLAGSPEKSMAADQPAGHITGIGGVFFKAKDPKALAAWYRDVLGLPVQSWGGAALHYDAQNHPPAAAWMALPASSNHMAPSTGDFMVNYAIDDMDALVARLTEKKVEILKRDDSDPNGRFAWVLDPEGNKVELWQPK